MSGVHVNLDNPVQATQLCKELRAELLAIAHDVYPRKGQPESGSIHPAPSRVFASTSTTTGLAGRIYQFVDRLDERTGNRLAN